MCAPLHAWSQSAHFRSVIVWCGVTANCKLQSISTSDKQRIQLQSSRGKVAYTHELVTVERLPNVIVDQQEELLVSYDGSDRYPTEDGFFYLISQEDDTHCAWCFRKDFPQFDPIVLCEGKNTDGTPCRTGRHLCCMPVKAQLQLKDLAHTAFFCAAHIVEPVKQPGSFLVSPPPAALGRCLSTASRHAPNHAGSSEAALPKPSYASAFQSARGAARVEAQPSAPHTPFAMPSIPSAPRAVITLTPPDPLRCATVLCRPPSPEIHEKHRPAATSLRERFDASAHSRTANVPVQTNGSSSSNSSSSSGSGSGSGSSSSSDSDWSAVSISDNEDNPPRIVQSHARTPPQPHARDSPSVAPLCLRQASSVRKSEQFQLESKYSQVLEESVSKEMMRMIVSAAQLAASKRKSGQLRHRGAGWSLRWVDLTGRMDTSLLPGWAQLAAASPKKRMRVRSKHGVASWPMANHLHNDWCEFQSCCGSRERCAALLAGLSEEQQQRHSCVSVQNMLAQRIRMREASPSKQDFQNRVVEAIEQRSTSNGLQTVILPDGGAVCVSCYRAVIGVSRSSLFRRRARVSLLGLCDDIAANRTELPSELMFAGADAGAALELASEIGKEEHSKRSPHAFLLTRALLLQFVQEHGQFDPAGDTEGADSAVIKHVLPMRSMPELVAGLDALLMDHLREGNQVAGYSGPMPHPPSHASTSTKPRTDSLVSRTTLQRVIDSLEKNERVRVTITQTKGVCRCDDCEKLDQQRKKLPAKSLQRQLVMRLKREHLHVAARQRSHFNDKKAQALNNPLQLWTITFDGFDQSKTKLPHRPRRSKFLDNFKRNLIGIHVVGVFAFGAPLPVMAYFNDDTITKDSNLSTTILYDILDRQWRFLLNDYMQASESTQPTIATAGSASHAATLLEAANRYAASKWPRQLHLTFDNAAGEAKNQFFFLSVGALVHRGVFQAITLSTLLVGHTHDIVDQMFSVWAVRLRITCVHTLSKLKAMFRAAYSTRIKALTDLLRQYSNCAELDKDGNVRATTEPQPTEQQLRETGFNIIADIHAYCAFNKAQRADVHKLRPEWSLDYVARLQSISHELRTVAPEMYDVPYAVDVKGWLTRNAANIKCEASMTGLTAAHVFGIEKDPVTGHTYLYNSFLADSVKESRENERHHYPNQLTGSYTTRTIMYTAASQLPHAPHRKLAVPVDFALYREAVEAFAVDHLDAEERVELDAMIDKMEQRVLSDAAACPDCRRLMNELQQVGVISRKTDQTAEEKELARKQTNAKDKIKRELKKHLADESVSEQHRGLVLPQWFGQWDDRARDNIQDEFLRRETVEQAKQQFYRDQLPYHAHPLELCSGKGEPVIFEATESVQYSWHFSRGRAPLEGDYIVVRSQEPNEPFMVGKIKKLMVNEESELRKRQALEKRQSVMDELCGFDKGISRVRAQPLHARIVDLDAHDQTLLRYMSRHVPGTAGEIPETDLRSLWRTEYRCFEVRASRHAAGPLGQPCPLGLFAVRDIAEGEPIEWYSICLTDKDDLRSSGAPKTHACSVAGTSWVLDGWPVAQALPRYIARTEEAQVRMLTMPASYFHPRQVYGSTVAQTPQQAQLMERWDSLPKGSLANSASADPEKRNCKMARHACARDLSCLNITELPYLQATRAIKRGEELLSSYRNNEERTEWEPAMPSSADIAMESGDMSDADRASAPPMQQADEVRFALQAKRHCACLHTTHDYNELIMHCLLCLLCFL